MEAAPANKRETKAFWTLGQEAQPQGPSAWTLVLPLLLFLPLFLGYCSPPGSLKPKVHSMKDLSQLFSLCF